MRTKSLWDYPRLTKSIILALFRPLLQYKDEVFQHPFFIELSDEATKLRNTIQAAEPYGDDVFLRGVKGGGKTHFLKWFLETPRYSEDMRDRHLFVDLHATTSLNREDVFEKRVREILIELIKEYFRKVKDAYRAAGHDLRGSSRKTYESWVKLILKYREKKKPLLLFLDDIDYCDRFLPNLVRLIKPFRGSLHCVVIQAVRNPAYNAIMACSDYPIGELAITQCLDPVNLPVFGPQQILSRRLDLICDEKKIGLREKVGASKLVFDLLRELYRRIKEFFREAEQMQDQVKGEERKKVQTIKLPFSHPQYEFIEGMSNGNINYIEVIGKEMMECLRKNRSEITEEIEGYSVPDRAIFDHFTQIPTEKIQIQNLHKERSHQYLTKKQRQEKGIKGSQVGNSLYVILLEFLMGKSSISSTDEEWFEEYGFKADVLEEPLRKLFDMELTDEKAITYKRALGGPNVKTSPEYYVTPRGKYYLRSLLYWPEYIDTWGRSRHHRTGMRHPQGIVVKDLLLDFVVKIFIKKEDLGREETEFKINKKNLLSFFLDLYGQTIKRLFMTGPRGKAPITIRNITLWLSDLGIIEKFEVTKHDNYLFYESATRLACKNRGMSWAKRAPYDEDFFRNIVEKFTKTPKSYTSRNSKEK